MTITIATDTDVMPPDLRRGELCRDLPDSLSLFFSEELTQIAEAKRICAVCPAIVSCLEGAIRRAEPCGVWGGQLFERGRIVRIKRRRGRPPKQPRPEDQVPDLPIPEHLRGDRHQGRRLLTA